MIQGEIYLPQGFPIIYSTLYSPSLLPQHLCILWLHSPSPLSLYLRTAGITQFSAKLSGGGGGGGGGGEKWIFLPQLLPGPLHNAHLFSSISYTLIFNPQEHQHSIYPNPKEHKSNINPKERQGHRPPWTPWTQRKTINLMQTHKLKGKS